jgi:Cys-tRNA(Pro) deacylase
VVVQPVSTESVERVRKYLERYDRKFTIMEFDVDTSTCDTAAAALGVEPAQIAKSLLFKGGDEFFLVVTCGDMKVDGKALAAVAGVKKVSMADAETVLRVTGYPVGGVSPVAHREPVRVMLDASMKRFDVVYAAAGTPKSAIPFSFDDLLMITGGETVDICIRR